MDMLREQDDQDEIQDEYSQQKGLFDEDGQDLTEDQFEKMMNQWKQEGAQEGMGYDMMKEWNKVWEEEGQMQSMFGQPQTRTI